MNNHLSGKIRKKKPETSDRNPCFICGKWQSITHCHHVVGVGELAKWCEENNVTTDIIPVKFVWLCPNHHEWLHRMSDAKAKNPARAGELVADITDAEWERYELLESDVSDLWGELWRRQIIVRDEPNHYKQWLLFGASEYENEQH
jgi:hypothetical protein